MSDALMALLQPQCDQMTKFHKIVALYLHTRCLIPKKMKGLLTPVAKRFNILTIDTLISTVCGNRIDTPLTTYRPVQPNLDFHSSYAFIKKTTIFK